MGVCLVIPCASGLIWLKIIMNRNVIRWLKPLTYLFFCISLFISSSLALAKTSDETPRQQISERSSFASAFIGYIEEGEIQGQVAGVSSYLSEFAMVDLEDIISTFGREKVRKSLSVFPAHLADAVFQAQGEDFFIMVLHQTVRSIDYLAILDEIIGLDHEALLSSVLGTKSRYTGGLMVLQEIEETSFAAVVQAFANTLPPGVFIRSFYNDPYLLASAVRIIAKRDPGGDNLREFLALVPNNHNLSDLFTEDLPGLVVAFATIEEISKGSKVSWATQTLSITEEHLARLILQKPANLAYILYGSHRIGIENFKKIINDLGQERFATVLDRHSGWLANFLAGMKKVTTLSTAVDFEEIKTAEELLASSYSYLLYYDSHLGVNKEKVQLIFSELPSAQNFLESSDLSIRIRVYLLGLVAVYQQILQEQAPDTMLSPLQFDLLKQQIIYSTRFSEHFDNMLSNFEVGRAMVEDVHMETIILLLAHELAHQIYSISGFDAPLLSAATIHECSADIGARAIGEKLGYRIGIQEYNAKYVIGDDFSSTEDIGEKDLLLQQDPHKIGRTQLGYIVHGLRNSGVTVDWARLFSINLYLLKDKTKMKHLLYVRDLVGGYIYTETFGGKPNEKLLSFLHNYVSNYDSTLSRQSKQIAEVSTVEEMITIARSTFLHASTARW